MTGLRVLQVINEMGTGGAERVVAEQVRGGAARGWTTAVLSAGGVRADELAAEGFTVARMRLARRSPWALLASVRDARRCLRRVEPDVVLAHNVLVSIVIWIAVHTLRRRPAVVTVFHGVDESDYRGAARALSLTSDAVVAVSDAIAGRLRAAGLARTRLTVVRNAVAPPARRDPAAARRALGVAPDAAVALCAARMVPQKRHDVLLQAWERLPGEPVLLLAGDGPLRAGLEAQAAPLGDRVRFLGRREDMPELLSAADVTVLSSDWEGLPMVALESMAAGRPMVSTDVDGVREALAGEPAAGVLVPRRDPDALAAALRSLLDDPSRRQALARAGMERIARDHDPDGALDRYDELLRDARAGGPVGRPGRVWVAVRAGLAGVLVAAAVLTGVTLSPERYQGTVSLVARPTAGTSAVLTGDVTSTNYGEVVALALPSLPELATSPTLLANAAAQVPGGPSAEQLRQDTSIELLPASGVARVSVRSDDPELAARLSEAVAGEVERADLLAPAATLGILDREAVVGSVAPGGTVAIGAGLLAGLVAAAAVAALLLPRRRPGTHAVLLRAIADAGRGPVPVLDGDDPVLAGRVQLLAGDRVPRVVAAGPGLLDTARTLSGALRPERVAAGPGPGSAGEDPVVAVADRRRTRPSDLTAALGALPADAPLLAVVLV